MKDKERESKKERHKREKEERRRRRRCRSRSRSRSRSGSSESVGGGGGEEAGERRWGEEEEEGGRGRRRRSQSGGAGEASGAPAVHRKKKCRRHRRRKSSSPRIKEEPRDSEPRGRERSRWENGNDSPPDRGRRGGSMLRAMKGEGGGGEEIEWGRKGGVGGGGGEGGGPKPAQENKAKPDFALSGKLAQDTNMFNGVIIKYSEPADSRKPKRRWRLYPFKGDVGLATMYVHRQSAYLIGRDRNIADLPVDHPSCSKQHAVLQYRAVPRPNASGLRVAPYIIDLESANGTYINNNKIEARKFVELFEKDVIKFAYSSREYVLLHEHSKDDDDDDDLQE